MVIFGQKTAFFGPWNQTTKKKYHPSESEKKNTTFGFKKSAETWTWNHFGFQKN